MPGHVGQDCAEKCSAVHQADAGAVGLPVRLQPHGELFQLHAVGTDGDGYPRVGDDQRPWQNAGLHSSVGGGGDSPERGQHRHPIAGQVKVRGHAGQLDPVHRVDRAARAEQRAQGIMDPHAPHGQQPFARFGKQLQIADQQGA